GVTGGRADPGVGGGGHRGDEPGGAGVAGGGGEHWGPGRELSPVRRKPAADAKRVVHHDGSRAAGGYRAVQRGQRGRHRGNAVGGWHDRGGGGAGPPGFGQGRRGGPGGAGGGAGGGRAAAAPVD